MPQSTGRTLKTVHSYWSQTVPVKWQAFQNKKTTNALPRITLVLKCGCGHLSDSMVVSKSYYVATSVLTRLCSTLVTLPMRLFCKAPFPLSVPTWSRPCSETEAFLLMLWHEVFHFRHIHLHLSSTWASCLCACVFCLSLANSDLLRPFPYLVTTFVSFCFTS